MISEGSHDREVVDLVIALLNPPWPHGHGYSRAVVEWRCPRSPVDVGFAE